MMVVHPAVQEKAQSEIDTVVGKDRLPTMDDRPLLPYLDAISREMLRYMPIVPLCASFRVSPSSCSLSSHITQRFPMLLWTTTCMKDSTFRRVNIGRSPFVVDRY